VLELLGAPGDFSAVAGARITLTASDSEWDGPAATVVPVSYNLAAPTAPLSVTIVNQGPVAARVKSSSNVIFFDATDTPAYWSPIISGTPASSAPYDLPVGSTYQLNAIGISVWTGRSTKLLVLLDYFVPANP